MALASRYSNTPIPIHLIKEYSYCPRYAYYMVFTRGLKYTTESMEIALKSTIQGIDALIRRYCREGTILSEYPVYSRSLGIYGKVDYLCIMGDEAAVIEVKGLSRVSRRSLFSRHRHFLNQAVAYAVAVEESVGKVVRRVAIIAKDKVVEVKLTPALKSSVIKLIEEARDIIEREELPRGVDDPAKCSYCFFRRLCKSS